MRIKKYMAAWLGICVLALSGFSACADQYRTSDSQEEETDETKTQLYVQNFSGGFGSDWL